MNIQIIGLSITLFSILSGGCATLSEPECRNADWYMIGIEDGIKGSLPSHIGKHRKACSKYNVIPDINAYRGGHAEGIKQYCTESSGFSIGKKGKSYNGVCPSGLETDFVKGYRIGKQFHDLSSDIDRADGAIYSYKKSAKKLDKEVRKIEQLLIADATTREERKQLLDMIKEKQFEIGELEEKILEHEKQKAVKENEYLNLQRRYNY